MEIFIHIIILCWVIGLYVFGLWIFGDGFLLKRNELSFKNTITKTSMFSKAIVDHNLKERNRFLNTFNRSIIILIDALRYDFAHSSTDDDYYKNKLTVLDELSRNGSGLLFKFQAHPPTTTMQRLKGLTTGSLPTFIDISANFASSEINEDNIIHQLISNGKKIVFMGDDTWESLFPRKFLRSYAFPSFNVKDLHTVDNGIIRHLIPEMKKTDWNVIISHFLGVDHCGHRYGPSHPEMSKKLYQMDKIIRDVIQNMNNDTVLLVFGDHGMTRTGDHGGDSEDEIYSALFIYNPMLHNKNTFNREDSVINQIDLVPTFSLLLGIPIPFSNLGSVIVPLFASLSYQNNVIMENLDNYTKQLIFVVSALSINSQQVYHYISVYNREFNEISPKLLKINQHNLEELEKIKIDLKINVLNKNINQAHLLLNELYQGYIEYLYNIRNICEKMWAKFDIISMIKGIIILFCAIMTNAFIIIALNSKMLAFVLKKIMIICSIITPVTIFLIVLQIASIKKAIQIGVLGYALGSVLITISSIGKVLKWDNIWKTLTYVDKVSIFITLLNFLIFFSNSFIIYENVIIIYFLLTMLIISFLPGLISHCRNNLRTNKILDIVWFPILFFVLIINVRIGGLFFKCREEQWPCTSSSFLIPLSSFPPEWQDYRTPRLMLSSSSIIIIMLSLWCWFYYKNRLTYHSPVTLCAQYSLPIATLSICFYWTLDLVPQQLIDQLVQQQQNLLPQTSVTLSCITVFVLFFSPLLVAEEHSLSGVGTLFVECTYSLGLLLFSLLPIIFLLAGDGLAPVILLIIISTILYLYLLSSFQNKDDHISLPWHIIVTWNLFVSNGFFITGHQYSFSSIHWQAAFITTSSDVTNYILSGSFIILNTFSSHFLFGIALPLLLTCPQAYLTFGQHKRLKINLQSFHLSLFQLFLKYILFNGIKLLGAVMSCFYLKRHLMVWKIFSPRLIFEIIGFFVTLFSVAFGYIFILLVRRAFHKLVFKLSQNSWNS